jgi:hypothetical protein
MRRRLDLAQAMMHRPRVLFLDEPTTGLDVQARNALWVYLRSLAADGTTIVLTTQYLEEADRLCDRVAILDRGTLVTVGTPAALKDAVGEDRVIITLVDPADAEQHAHARRVASGSPSVLNVVDGDGTIIVQLRSAGDSLLELVRRLDIEGVDVARLQLADDPRRRVHRLHRSEASHRDRVRPPADVGVRRDPRRRVAMSAKTVAEPELSPPLGTKLVSGARRSPTWRTTRLLARRNVLKTWRSPAFISFSLLQALVWLVCSPRRSAACPTARSSNSSATART